VTSTAATDVRVLLLTGKGGVGKTTLAAATAAGAAARGLRTLVISTDHAHSLGDAFAHEVGDEPTPVADGLHVQHVSTQRRFEQSWLTVQGYLRSVLDAAGVDPMSAEELTVLPGAEEVIALLELRRQVRSGAYDVVVVDCAPTAETLRLLALPEALNWYMDRIFPANRRIVGALRPVLSRAAGVPMPQDAVFEAFAALHADLADLHELLTGKNASVRLVLTPERVVLAEARRTYTSLALFGYAVDGVVANRVFPAEGADAWRQGWVEAQESVLTEVEESFAGLPVWRSAYRAEEPTGVESLQRLGDEVYAGSDPLALPEGPEPFRLEREGAEAQVVLALPLASRGDLDLSRHADDLIVTVGSYRRVLALPTALRGSEVVGAKLRDGALRVRLRLAGQGES
jgi:arsenite-transporting ATPase